jgi:hypothetical protein
MAVKLLAPLTDRALTKKYLVINFSLRLIKLQGFGTAGNLGKF